MALDARKLLLCLVSFWRAAAAPEDLLGSGFLDVTAPPFNVDNTGLSDCTQQLQKAVDFARASFLVSFLPHGTYVVSDSIVLPDPEPWVPGESRQMNNTHPCRFQPNVVVGARARWAQGSEEPLRPIIRLADNAPGFDDAAHPKAVLDYGYGDTNFNQLLKGVDVHIGSGTPAAVGVRFPGAQGCAVADTTILVGSGYAGIIGGSGAGGGNAMVKIVGGKVGLDYTISLNTPGTTGMVLINQSEAAILYTGLEAASFVGFTIKPANAGVPALRSKHQGTMWGQASMVDSVIEYAASPSQSSPCTAFDTSHSLYLKNVYIRNCDFVTAGVAGSANSLALVDELASGVAIPNGGACKSAPMPIYIDGSKFQEPLLVRVMLEDVKPPAERMLRQHRWDEQSFPSFDMPGVVSVDSFGAKGDGVVDDTNAIQKAIDVATVSQGTVFLPKGFYRVSRTINMTAAALVGVARSLSVLMPMSDGLTGMGPGPWPILRVRPLNSSGLAVVTMLSIATWEHLDNVWAMWWQATHADSVYRDNYFYRTTECFFGFPHPKPVPVPASFPTMECRAQAQLGHPLNVVSDGGAGRFYNFENEDFLYEAPSYRHLLVRDTPGPVYMYNFNFEHASSEANAEFFNSSNIHVFSLKSEGEWRDVIYHGGKNNPGVALWIRDCSHVNIYSFGGNAKPLATGSAYPAGFAQYPPSQYRIENSCPVRVTNCVDQFQFPPADDWNFVFEKYFGQEVLSEHCDRPVLYSRESCAADSWHLLYV